MLNFSQAKKYKFLNYIHSFKFSLNDVGKFTNKNTDLYNNDIYI